VVRNKKVNNNNVEFSPRVCSRHKSSRKFPLCRWADLNGSPHFVVNSSSEPSGSSRVKKGSGEGKRGEKGQTKRNKIMAMRREKK